MDFKKYYDIYNDKKDIDNKNVDNINFKNQFIKKVYIINRCVILYWILKILSNQFDNEKKYGKNLIKEIHNIFDFKQKNNIIYFFETINKILLDINIIKKYI